MRTFAILAAVAVGACTSGASTASQEDLQAEVADLRSQLEESQAALADAQDQLETARHSADELELAAQQVTSAVDDFRSGENWRETVPDVEAAADELAAAADDMSSAVAEQ